MVHSFCLLGSMGLIPIPNCSLLHLHSNDTNNLKSLLLKKSYSYKHNEKKIIINKVGVYSGGGGGGDLHLKPPKFVHIFVAVITSPPFFCADLF